MCAPFLREPALPQTGQAGAKAAANAETFRTRGREGEVNSLALAVLHDEATGSGGVVFVVSRLGSGEQALRLHERRLHNVVEGFTSAFSVPGINDRGRYPRFYLRNPGINNHDPSILRNIPFGGEGKYRLQLRVEMFDFLNHTQFSGVNRTTNMTNAAGQIGAALFGDFTGLTATTNLRPAGNTSVLGTYFGEYNGARPPAHYPTGGDVLFLNSWQWTARKQRWMYESGLYSRPGRCAAHAIAD